MLVQALPDGTMQAESDVVPARADVGGVWTSIDTTLQKRPDGWYEPKIAAAGVRFGPGDTTQIAQIQSESGQWFSEAWPYGKLPIPAIDGAHALYSDVFPGVDLRLTATDAGMSEVLVIKTAAAAANPQLADVTLAVQGATVQQGVAARSLQAEVSASAPPVASATPLWWDSSVAGSSADTPGGDEPRAVPTTSTTSSVSLDVQSVAETTPTYPVYVDPDWSSYLQADWYTDRAYPNQSYLDPPSDSVGYGIDSGVGYLSHAFFQLTTNAVAHKHIIDAKFNIHQSYANSCDTTAVQLWEYGPGTAGFTWNGEPNHWSYMDDQKSSINGGPCAGPANVGFNATHAVTYAASVGQGNIQLGMRVANEANSLTRKHYDWNAQLIITYNTAPATPTSPTFVSPSRTCSTSASSPVYVNNGATQPLTLQVTQTDADGSGYTVNDGFYVYSATGTTILYQKGSGTVGQGSVRIQFPAKTLSPGAYRWNARAGDGTDLSAGYSPYCYFTVLNDGPDLPSLSLPQLNAGDHYTVGSPITATIGFNPTQHVAMLAVWWAVGTTPTIPVTLSGGAPSCSPAPVVQTVRLICPDSTTGSVTVQVSVPSELSSLSVTAFDAAGNPVNGTTTTATQSVAALADKAHVADSAGHRWPTDALDIINSNPASVQDVDTGHRIDLTGGTPSAWVDNNDGHGPSLTFPGSAPAMTASAVAVTTQSFTVSAWLTPANNTITGTYTALSHGTGNDSDFTLGVADGKWQFCARVPGSPSATKPDCVVGAPITTNQATFVTGTYDAANSLISISFGNSKPFAYANHVVPATATPTTGGLLVGADHTAGGTAHGWSGQINDPSIYQGVAVADQLQKISLGIDPGSGL